ncbi:MAG: aminotransferase class I/II-fold pyridoxal phosphate-dependent enzyme [Acidobacteriota bacterium]
MSLEAINRDLESSSPSLWKLLSKLGRRAYFPPDIPFQAKQAEGTSINGTIGVFTDGRGNAMPLPSMAEATTLEGDELNRAFLYSPVLGFPDVRRAWADWQRTGQGTPAPAEDAVTTLPAVLGGLTHGLSMVADLFADEGRPLLIGKPFWGNYRNTFGLRRGADIREIRVYENGRYNPQALLTALEGLPFGEPAMVLVNFPSNPGGYSPGVDERQILRDGFAEAASKRPLMVICDDAYAGLVFEDGVPNRSLFWDLLGLHVNLLPVKIDGATKEFAFFGGRTAFLTLGVDLDEAGTAALENKLQCLSRATIGSPSATAQVLLHRTLKSGRADDEVAAIRRVAVERYDAVQPALAALDPELLRPLPFNAGFFVLMQLAPGLDLDPHDVRTHLIEHHDTGIVAARPDYLRLAVCSVAAESLPEMVRRVEQAVRELRDRA